MFFDSQPAQQVLLEFQTWSHPIFGHLRTRLRSCNSEKTPPAFPFFFSRRTCLIWFRPLFLGRVFALCPPNDRGCSSLIVNRLSFELHFAKSLEQQFALWNWSTYQAANGRVCVHAYAHFPGLCIDKFCPKRLGTTNWRRKMLNFFKSKF